MKSAVKFFSALSILLAFISCSEDAAEDVTAFSITSVNPVSGSVGTEITLRGTNFPTDPSAVEITLGGVPATISSLTSTELVTRVPEGATSGELKLSVNGLSETALPTFTVLDPLEAETVENLFAPQTGGQGQGEIGGAFTRFSFESGGVTDSETDWDIAFRGTTIAVNGGVATGTNDEPERNGNAGAALVSGIFEDITSAEGLTFIQDADGAFAIPTGSDQGWYNYNFMTNVVSPIPGVVLVFRTHDGRFAKVEILSYYENAPANPDGFADASRYYTFRYVFNPNDGETRLSE